MAALWDKVRARWKLGRQVSLWYHPGYEAPSLAKIAQSLGMVALRGKRALAQLAKAGLIRPGDLQPFPLAPLSDLALFHSESYLERVGRTDTLSRIFGIPESEVRNDEILQAVRWTVSGTVSAAQSVLKGSTPLAINLGGGFHHAEPEMGGGFCVFNDIGVAIRKIRRSGFRKNIAIVDLDFHQGNGNVVGFLDDETVLCYSLHGAIWTPDEGVGNFNQNIEGEVRDSRYLTILEDSLPDFLAEAEPGLVFFIAGHDVLQEDPLGLFGLSLEGTARRDRLILKLLRDREFPAVITLGGGYSEAASQATLNLLVASLNLDLSLTLEQAVETSPPFRKVLAKIDPSNPQFDEGIEFSLSEADLWQDLSPSPAAAKLFGQLSAFEIERELETCCVLERLRAMGFEDLRIGVDARNPQAQKVYVDAHPLGQLLTPLFRVAELVLRQEALALLPGGQTMNLLSLEDLRLKGLDLSPSELQKEFQDFFRRICLKLGWDGILRMPAFFHMATTGSGFQFLSPEDQGRFEAMEEVLSPLELGEASARLQERQWQLEDGTVVEWKAARQLLPLRGEIGDYFRSRDYLERSHHEKSRYLAKGLRLAERSPLAS
ncbi:MAG: histone deacetylase [bacterium]